MNEDKMLEVANQFGFADVPEMLYWAESFEPEYQCRGVNCLYTDGDSGIVLIKGYNDVEQWEGVSIVPVYGDWCECNLFDLMNILETIKRRLADDKEKFDNEL
jgi:hypothetical protein